MQSLFGGALVADFPAPKWLDASDVRPVPDHQEVWLEPAGAQRSLIIEILELAECASTASAEFHFEDLATSNGATSSRVIGSSTLDVKRLRPSLQKATGCFLLHGLQELPPTENTGLVSSKIEVRLGVVRLDAKSSDILVSICRPRGSTGETAAVDTAADAELLASVLSTLDIRDSAIFGE